MKPSFSLTEIDRQNRFFYTHECKEDEIAYFKVDVNLIDNLENAYLGYVRKMYEIILRI